MEETPAEVLILLSDLPRILVDVYAGNVFFFFYGMSLTITREPPTSFLDPPHRFLEFIIFETGSRVGQAYHGLHSF